MPDNRTDVEADARSVLEEWVYGFGAALTAGDSAAAADFFLSDGYWKDILSFTWAHCYFSGRPDIAHAFALTAPSVAPKNFRVSEDRTPPRHARRAGRRVVEGYFDFDTASGKAAAFIRLQLPQNDARPQAWILLTALQELDGFGARAGARRPSGEEYAMNALGRSWMDDVKSRQGFHDRDPEFLVIGAGHAGLVAAARLDQAGVDTLVVERSPRVGDVWRNRYRSLTLHNELMANHLPFMPFPDTWPVWLTKDHMAIWLETYAECMALNVWTSSEVTGAEWSETDRRWTVTIDQAGERRTLHPQHVVVATGVSGNLPHYGTLPGLDGFAGDVVHSSTFEDGAQYSGKNAIVVGTGNSAHDIAQDLHVKGAASVSLLQRGPTCVISLQPGAEMIYKIYSGDDAIEDIDLMAASIPYPVLEDSYRFITRKAAAMDKGLLDGLNARGFRTHFGSDGTGFQMMFMRGEGGYYIDVGCSQLIIDGHVGVIQHSDIEGFETGGLRMKDGRLIETDLVVLATGFKNMQENVRQLFGDEVAEKVGLVWGFDDDHQMRAMWRRTGQEGLWITGGSLLDSRIFSRFLAIEITAALRGILPAPEDLPLAKAGAQ